MPTIKRTVYFYDLDFVDKQGNPIIDWRGIFRYANGLIGRSRCQERSDRLACFRFLRFNPNKVISGNLVFIREQAISRITHLDNDTDRDLIIAANEGLVETTHFAISYGRENRSPLLAIEYNHFGPRVGDLGRLLKHHAASAGIPTLAKVIPTLVVKEGNLDAIFNQLGRVSSLKMRVYRNDIERINEYAPSGMVSGFRALNAFDQADYLEMKYKFDYAHQTTGQQVRESLLGLVQSFRAQPERMQDFDMLEAQAEDTGTGGSIRPFDLLDAELRLDLDVATVPGYARVIDDTDITARLIDAALQYANHD